MPKYIEKGQILLGKFTVTQESEYARGWNDGLEAVAENAPAADVVPVMHGRWIKVKNPQWPAYEHDQCSVCQWWNTKNAMIYEGRKSGRSLNFCPNCGADMRGEPT